MWSRGNSIYRGRNNRTKTTGLQKGSILLGELIANKIVLEYIDQPEIRRKIEQLTIFSDSQTAIGILNLHWKIENHKRITLEILDKMKRIQKNGIEINKNSLDTRTCEC